MNLHLILYSPSILLRSRLYCSASSSLRLLVADLVNHMYLPGTTVEKLFTNTCTDTIFLASSTYHNVFASDETLRHTVTGDGRRTEDGKQPHPSYCRRLQQQQPQPVPRLVPYSSVVSLSNSTATDRCVSMCESDDLSVHILKSWRR